MNFNSYEFLLFFPIVTVLYWAIPKKVRYIWLLLCSYLFYMCWSPKYALLLLASTLITYFSGLALEWAKDNVEGHRKANVKKMIVCLSVVLNMGILFFFKYFNLAINIMNGILAHTNRPEHFKTLEIMLPVGISFFTFQALSYTVDVYRDEVYAEKNFFRYALYVSFFPQLVAGPIERSKSLLRQLANPIPVNFEKARDGFLLMLWGYFLKIVLADRIAIIVDTVYDSWWEYSGWYYIVATVFFSIQIYCDFAGYSTIARGAAEILGITLMENFDAPYISKNVSEFWRRWHISLTSWFRDYLYIPLGGNKKGRLRKYINCMVVFLASGLWHGASIHFIVWGGINGLYQILGDLMSSIRRNAVKVLGLNPASIGYRMYKTIVTFILISISWVYFRAQGIWVANRMVHSMIKANNPWILFDGSLYKLGLNEKNFRLMIIGIAVLAVSDVLKRKGICIRKVIAEQDYLFRWLFIAASIVAILIFGIWGGNYDASNFIYFQF